MIKKFSEQIQKRPLLIVGMFFISVLSSILTLLLGWAEFYRDYLSMSFEVPVWLLILLAVIIPTVWMLGKSKERAEPITEYEKIEGKAFGVQQINLDGRNFQQCRFSGSELIYSGKYPFKLQYCDIESSRFSLAGPARLTLMMLTTMYADPAMRPIIEATIENIRNGITPESLPTS